MMYGHKQQRAFRSMHLCFFKHKPGGSFSMPRVAKKAGICLLAFPYSCRAPCDPGCSVSIIQRQWHGRRDWSQPRALCWHRDWEHGSSQMFVAPLTVYSAECFCWSSGKGFSAGGVTRLCFGANVGLKQSWKAEKEMHKGVGMTASTPRNKARTFLAAHSNEKQQIRPEEPIITIILFTVSQFTVWHVNAE